MKIFLIGVLVYVGILPGLAQGQTDNGIDKVQAKCLKTHSGTMPRAKCYSDAFEAWEKNIAQTYAEMRSVVPTATKHSLETAQKAWETFRDAEFDFIGERYANRKGTGYIAIRIILRIDVLKPRALQLEKELGQIKGTE